jgi:aspartokinase-like uncharacterized kinase
MTYSYDYIQARVAEVYDEAERRRTHAAPRRRPGGGRFANLVRRHRDNRSRAGCTE